MRNKVLTIQEFILLVGFMIQGIFGIIGGILLSAIIGLCYGFFKRDRVFVKYSAITLILVILGIILFCFCLQSM